MSSQLEPLITLPRDAFETTISEPHAHITAHLFKQSRIVSFPEFGISVFQGRRRPFTKTFKRTPFIRAREGWAANYRAKTAF
jgi:hypothetical protein